MSKKNFFVEFNDCILCEECPQETIMHLFFECSISQSFWWAIGIEWNYEHILIPIHYGHYHYWLLESIGSEK
jgi:hypothetical protein